MMHKQAFVVSTLHNNSAHTQKHENVINKVLVNKTCHQENTKEQKLSVVYYDGRHYRNGQKSSQQLNARQKLNQKRLSIVAIIEEAGSTWIDKLTAKIFKRKYRVGFQKCGLTD